jgi:hypothetical protein
MTLRTNFCAHTVIQFIKLGQNVISFQVVDDIEPGQEITAFYSADYFGPGNLDCLCETCEKFQRNGYDPLRTLDGGIAPETTQQTSEIDQLLKRGTSRTANARSRSFNYYGDHYNGGEVFCPGKKKAEAAEKQNAPKCYICWDHHEEVGSLLEFNTNDDPCQKCIRHSLIFGWDWPDRKGPSSRDTFLDSHPIAVHFSKLKKREEWHMRKKTAVNKRANIRFTWNSKYAWAMHNSFAEWEAEISDDEDSGSEPDRDEIERELPPLDPGPDYPDYGKTLNRIFTLLWKKIVKRVAF